MNSRKLNSKAVVCAITAISTFAASNVFAAGLEKSVFWSGHYAGLAGAAQSSVTGPEALYWNPAGLAGSAGLQLAGDFSPTLAKFNGSTANVGAASTQSISSNTSFSPVGGGFVSYAVSPQWTAGLGYFVSGGTKAIYDGVNFNDPAAPNFSAPLKADFAITELSAGTGYEVIPGLKIGASYRVVFVKANLDVASINAGTGTITSLQFNSLSATQWNGFRLGAMWAPKDSSYGLGATWRSRVNFAANSSDTKLIQAGATPGATPGGTTYAGTGVVGGNLPMRFDLAGHYAFMPAWTFFGGYSFTNYSVEQGLGLEADTTAGQTLSTLPLQWNNQHNIRGAFEYAYSEKTALRLGYVWTSQVTPNGSASPILAAPGTGNTFLIGMGHKCTDNLTVDTAFEYSRDSGTVAASDVRPANPGATATTSAGDYSAKAYALHIGATLAL